MFFFFFFFFFFFSFYRYNIGLGINFLDRWLSNFPGLRKIGQEGEAFPFEYYGPHSFKTCNAIYASVANIRPMPGGSLEYESDGYVPTGERKQVAFSVGFHRKKGVISCGIQKKNLAFLVVNFPK